MKVERIRLIGWSVVLMATAAFVLTAEPPADPTPPSVSLAAERPRPRTADGFERNGSRLEQSDAPHAGQRVAWGPASIDLFADPPPQQTPVAQAAPVPVQVPVAPPVPPPEPNPPVPAGPPAFPLQPIGQMQQDAEHIAFLLGPEGTVLVRAGNIVAQDWRVEAITDSQLQVSHVGTAHRTVVPLPPAR